MSGPLVLTACDLHDYLGYVNECPFCARWTRAVNDATIQESTDEMKSRGNRVVEVTKRMDIGILPSFISLAHRHFEKGESVGEAMPGQPSLKKFTLPLDLVRMTVPEEAIDGIEEISLVYRKG